MTVLEVTQPLSPFYQHIFLVHYFLYPSKNAMEKSAEEKKNNYIDNLGTKISEREKMKRENVLMCFYIVITSQTHS